MSALHAPMPTGFYRVYGGLAVVRVGRSLVGASPGEVVTVWDADTGERVTDLVADDGTTAVSSTVVADNGTVAPVGIPASVLRPLFQIGTSGAFLPPGSDSPSGAVLETSSGYAAAAASSASTASGASASAQGFATSAQNSATAAAGSASAAAASATAVVNTARNASPAAAADRGQVTLGALGVPFGSVESYDAFPGMAMTQDGRLAIVWRGGPSHTGGTDGKVFLSTSANRGATWSTPVTVYNPTLDVRDPSLTILADGTTWLITLFSYNTPADPQVRPQVLRSTDSGATWSAPVNMAPVGWAISAPAMDRGDGLLLAPLYNVPTSGNAVAAVVTSADSGLSWSAPTTAVTISGADVQEPALVRFPDGSLGMTYRYGAVDGIGFSTSSDGGTTWSAASRKFSGTGAPRAVVTSGSRLIATYRTVSGLDMALRVSDDKGATWFPEVIVDADLDDMAYATLVEVSRGVVAMVYSAEPTATSAQAHLRTVYVMSGDGFSPLGDTASRVGGLVGGARQVLLADDFQRPNGALGTPLIGRPWAGSAWLTIVDGIVASSTTGSAFAYSDLGTPDFTVEADVRWDNNSGAALVLRYVDASNYLLLTSETNGTAFRLYKVVAGTATQLGSATATSVLTMGNQWHTYGATCRGNKIVAYLDGTAAFAVDMTADANVAVFAGATRAGLRVNPVSASHIHKCRRFVAYA